MNIDLSKVPPDDTMSISARDRRFFTQLIRYMDMESEKVGPNPSRERYSVFRLSFEKVNQFHQSKKTVEKLCFFFFFEDHRTIVTL